MDFPFIPQPTKDDVFTQLYENQFNIYSDTTLTRSRIFNTSSCYTGHKVNQCSV